jgi:hypothetical protein
MKQHCNQITSLDGWSLYSPYNDVEGDGSCRDYSAVFTSSDMSLFVRVVQQLRNVEHENDMPFTSLISLEECDLSHWYHEAKKEWNIGQKKHQSKHVNRKQKGST